MSGRWEWFAGWNDDDPSGDFAREDNSIEDIMMYSNGVVIETPQYVTDEAFEAMVRACGFKVVLIVEFAHRMGWAVTQMWENAPNRDLTRRQDPWSNGSRERSPQ